MCNVIRYALPQLSCIVGLDLYSFLDELWDFFHELYARMSVRWDQLKLILKSSHKVLDITAKTQQNCAASTCRFTNGRHTSCVFFMNFLISKLKNLIYSPTILFPNSWSLMYNNKSSNRNNRFEVLDQFMCFITLHDSKLFRTPFIQETQNA